MDELKETLKRAGADIEEGPVERTGGRRGGQAKGLSLYTRDPDRNLLEFIIYGSFPDKANAAERSPVAVDLRR